MLKHLGMPFLQHAEDEKNPRIWIRHGSSLAPLESLAG